MTPVLKVTDLSASYRSVPAVSGVSLEVHEGELRVVLGANGAGKTTIIKAILGLLKADRGSVQFAGRHDLRALRPYEICRLGIAWVPEGRQLWGTLSVLDNLRMGAFGESDGAAVEKRIQEAFDRFPRLRERQHQLAASLSGGEQQMVAIARALVAKPKLILMDEPSLGLAPMVVRDIFELVQEINRQGISILMAEQNARQALRVSHWAYLLEVGRLVESGPASAIASKENIQEVFLGGRVHDGVEQA